MSFRSPFPDVDIPASSVYDFLFGSLDESDLARPALIDGASGAVTDYRTLVGQVDAVAGALAARGLGVGTVVGLLAPNVPAFASVFHGILRSGATATTINALYTAGEISKQLDDSGATALFTVSPFLPQAKEAAVAAGIPDELLIVLDGADDHPAPLRGQPVAPRPRPSISIRRPISRCCPTPRARPGGPRV